MDWEKEEAERKAKIAKVSDQIKGISSRERAISDKIRLLRKEAGGLQAEIKDLIAGALGISSWDIAIGTWRCAPSPLGKCIYDAREDPCLDMCLLCGDPDERK